MSAPTQNSFSYRKFAVKDAAKSASPKSKASADSVARLKLLETKYRSNPIPLAPGKSKAVAKRIVARKPGAKAAVDSLSPMPSKTAFYVGKKPIAYQG